MFHYLETILIFFALSYLYCLINWTLLKKRKFGTHNYISHLFTKLIKLIALTCIYTILSSYFYPVKSTSFIYDGKPYYKTQAEVYRKTQTVRKSKICEMSLSLNFSLKTDRRLTNNYRSTPYLQPEIVLDF